MSEKKRPLAVLALRSAFEPASLPDWAPDRLSRAFPGVGFHTCPFDPASIEQIEEAEILYSFTLTPQILASAKRLRWFHSIMTGADALPLEELMERGVTVTTPRGLHAVPVAETALGLMLALARRIRDCVSLQVRGSWAAADVLLATPPSTELSGSSVVIVGLGGIGDELARRCHAMEMRVTAIVRKKRPRPPYVEKVIPFADFAKELPSADFVVLSCPLTDKTRGMIGRSELGRMKRGAFLINVARGELVDEASLISALNDGVLAGAAFDAFESEPLPERHPFFSAPNMIVSPHVSGWSKRYWERCVGRFENNLELYLKGKKLIGAVDFKLGY